MKKYIARTIIFSFFLLPVFLYSRENININQEWKFIKGDPVNAETVDFDDADWRILDLPHDWAIEEPFDAMLPANTGKLPWKGVGWYRKQIDVKNSYSGNKIYIMFDGVMAFPEVYVNGKLAGKWDYGYNSFYVDITEFVNHYKQNVIAVKVDTRKFDSRWYPGAGIYRKVQMIVTNPVHIEHWGTYIQTPVVNEDSALVHVYTTITNTSKFVKEIMLQGQLTSPEGAVILTDSKSVTIEAGSAKKVEQWFTVHNPERWDVIDPKLYQLNSFLTVDRKIADSDVSKFGLRTFKFTANNGFWLNGRRVQLKGVNLHHDHGPLGAKFYPRAMERQLIIMKEMGVNAVRNSHNVAATELLEMCDHLGLIFFNEVFDKWDAKAAFLPEMDFDEFAERNISNWVKRDRNHPCVVLWSVGNEMGDIQYNIDGGFEKLNTMLSLVKKYDPSRPTTMVCDAKGSATWRHFEYYDVHSWNYGRRYLPARNLETGKSVVISESASTLSTRGFYELPLPENKTDFTQSLQVSSYDLNAPSWAEIADDDFMWQEEDTYVAGEFVWTGFDYLGEPTPYNDEAVADGFITQKQSAKSSYFGIVDLCGIPKDRYYLYKSHWQPDETTVHILPHWNWEVKEGENIPVFVYTNGDCVELFLNGRSLGKKCKNKMAKNSTMRYRLMWNDVPYSSGELKAIAYKEGDIIGESYIRTAGKPNNIKLSPDRSLLKAGINDLSYILVEAFDKNGNPCPLADNLVQFEIEGPAVIEGVGNGNPQSLEPFIARERKLFYGKAMLILKALDEEGIVSITARTKGLGSAKVKLSVE